MSTALEQYKSTYEGLKDSDLASIEQGRRLMELLQTAAPKYRGGLGLPEASLIVIGSNGSRQALYLPIKDLLDAGFPTDKPIALHLKIEQGPARNTDDDLGDETIHPFRTKNGIMIEVHDALDLINRFNEDGYFRIFLEIAAAAGSAMPVKSIPAAAIAPPTPPPADQHAAEAHAAAPKKGK